MQSFIENFDPFMPLFLNDGAKNTIVNMFNKQKSKDENYREMRGGRCVGEVKVQNLELNPEERKDSDPIVSDDEEEGDLIN